MDKDEYHREMQRLRAIQGGGDDKRPRMPLARVVELLLTRPVRATQEAVEITRNAKGDYQYTVSAVAQDGETLEECCVRAQEMADKLNTAYTLSRAQIIAQRGDQLIEKAQKAQKARGDA